LLLWPPAAFVAECFLAGVDKDAANSSASFNAVDSDSFAKARRASWGDLHPNESTRLDGIAIGGIVGGWSNAIAALLYHIIIVQRARCKLGAKHNMAKKGQQIRKHQSRRYHFIPNQQFKQHNSPKGILAKIEPHQDT